MIKFDTRLKIRHQYYEEGKTVSSIAKETGHDRKTIRIILDQEDFNLSFQDEGPPEDLCPSLKEYRVVINGWLLKDRYMPRKQRHTARRVYNRLKDEYREFDGSYATVNRYVQARRQQLKIDRNDPKTPLEHEPGSAQGDFGQTVFTENGIQHKGNHFVLSFPYSNVGLVQLNYGENMECLLEALDAIFRFIGGVPPEIWFDNASTMVVNVIMGGKKKMTERFARFAEHYRFTPVFMNRAKGNEKGNVEGKVGYTRRNLFVPEPVFKSLSQYNPELLNKCMEDADRPHYRKVTNMLDLFRKDREHLLPLPRVPFDLARYEAYKTTDTGMFVIDGKYEYSSSPEFRNTYVHVKLTSAYVFVLDPKTKKPLFTHTRLYGPGGRTIFWPPYLKYIAFKPKTYMNSGFREILPDELNAYLLSCEPKSRGKVLQLMADIADEKGFDEAVRLIAGSLKKNLASVDDLKKAVKQETKNLDILSDDYWTVEPKEDKK